MLGGGEMTKTAKKLRAELGLPEKPGDPVKPLPTNGVCDAGGKKVCNPNLLRRDPRPCIYDASAVMSTVGLEGRI